MCLTQGYLTEKEDNYMLILDGDITGTLHEDHYNLYSLFDHGMSCGLTKIDYTSSWEDTGVTQESYIYNDLPYTASVFPSAWKCK